MTTPTTTTTQQLTPLREKLAKVRTGGAAALRHRRRPAERIQQPVLASTLRQCDEDVLAAEDRPRRSLMVAPGAQAGYRYVIVARLTSTREAQD